MTYTDEQVLDIEADIDMVLESCGVSSMTDAEKSRLDALLLIGEAKKWSIDKVHAVILHGLLNQRGLRV